jgi:hypothetical protein
LELFPDGRAVLRIDNAGVRLDRPPADTDDTDE